MIFELSVRGNSLWNPQREWNWVKFSNDMERKLSWVGFIRHRVLTGSGLTLQGSSLRPPFMSKQRRICLFFFFAWLTLGWCVSCSSFFALTRYVHSFLQRMKTHLFYKKSKRHQVVSIKYSWEQNCQTRVKWMRWSLWPMPSSAKKTELHHSLDQLVVEGLWKLLAL